jgi:hypothetical protein
VVRRDFAADDRAAVLAALEAYGRESHEREVVRVRLAALRLAVRLELKRRVLR